MRLYYGTYGHHVSGKLYVYWGGDNLRTGQQVVAPVTNPRSGRTYNTMFTISRSQNQQNAQGEVSRLNGEGIFIKTIGGRDVLSLPGGAPFNSAAEWARESEVRYRRLHGLPPLPEPQTSGTAPRRTPAAEPGNIPGDIPEQDTPQNLAGEDRRDETEEVGREVKPTRKNASGRRKTPVRKTGTRKKSTARKLKKDAVRFLKNFGRATGETDAVTAAARGSLLSSRKVVADSFGGRERLAGTRQREAFRK